MVFVVAAAPFVLAIVLLFLARPLSAFLVDHAIQDPERPDEKRLFGMLEIQSWMGGLLLLSLGLVLLPDAFEVEIPGWQFAPYLVMLILVACLALAARPVVTNPLGGERSHWPLETEPETVQVVVGLISRAAQGGRR